jgi:hypothetical protein
MIGTAWAVPAFEAPSGKYCRVGLVECQLSRIEFRKRTGYLNASTTSLDEALTIIERARLKWMAGRWAWPVVVLLWLQLSVLPAEDVMQKDQSWQLVPLGTPTVLGWCWLILAALGMLALVTLLVTLFHNLASARPRSVRAFYSVGDQHIQ